MDFFEAQDVSRKKTKILIFYFILAVILIILAVYAGIMISIKFYFAYSSHARYGTGAGMALHWWYPPLFYWVVGITTLIVVTGSYYKMQLLSGGGDTVAQMLGGKRVNPNTTEENERKLLNVVEEVAIASGVAVPTVYLLEKEEGINAFAAGFNHNDAVIGVTRGCMNLLSRDELQGVIAHEFSHVLNGDMRMNIRLMGFLHGILLLGLLGYGMLRSLRYVRTNRNNKGGGGIVLVILLIGLILFIIGSIGTFFGKLIKSAVSRQREFLADASSVQFTRNPAGIAGALKKIGGLTLGSRLEIHTAEEASHLFFSDGMKKAFTDLLSTHPPLVERIKRIDPSFDGSFPVVSITTDESSSSVISSFKFKAKERVFPMGASQLTGQIGRLTADHIQYATRILSSQIPENLKSCARDPLGAQSLIYAMLLDPDREIREKQLKYIRDHTDSFVYKEVTGLLASLGSLSPDQKLPLADLCLPALRHFSERQYLFFRENIVRLSEADQKIDLFEYAFEKMISRKLESYYSKKKSSAVRYHALSPLISSCRGLLSALAWYGNPGETEAMAAFRAGMARIQKEDLQIEAREICSLKTVDASLQQIKQASFSIKKIILDSCTACAVRDGKVTVEEAELLRAIADTLDCPVPPFLE